MVALPLRVLGAFVREEKEGTALGNHVLENVSDNVGGLSTLLQSCTG